MEVIDQEAEYLGRGFASLIHLFSPELLVMGGGVAAAFDLMDSRIHDVIRLEAMPAFRNVRVVPAGLGVNSGLVGAAALALAAGEKECA
jgi:glucokinase